ncbi:MAG TPA: 2-oxoglutarate dehydrogenase E1 [Desulfosporosinus sp.]|nr:2-oxoglutarate dehydrogenase E1 [Desulfosporosinus sp.]
MRALTVWQPFATLLAERHKKIETRSWATNVRGAVAIHSAKKPFKEVKCLINPRSITVISNLLFPYSLERLPTGYVLAVGNLVDCKRIDEAFIETLSPTEIHLGDYTIGRYAWIFEDVKHFKTPMQAKGSLGFWDWVVPDGIEIA